MQDYSLAQEPREIGELLVPKYHEHLSNVRIEYVFLSEPVKSKGKEILGRAKKKSGLDAFLAMEAGHDAVEPFFVIEICKASWDTLKRKQKVALVDHELCHCLWDVDKGIFLRTHDLEEFTEIVKRHGLWQPDLEKFATIAAKHINQLELPIAEKTETAETAPAEEPSAKGQVKILKGGNGKQEPVEQVKKAGNGVADLKAEVARRRGGRPVAAAK